jgi:DNA-binding LytR/AlgR family response regulator
VYRYIATVNMKKNYTCVIVDDSVIDSTLLEAFLNTIGRVELIGTYSDSLLSIREINSRMPDILLADIEMPGCSGFELVKSLNYKPIVVFLSNHREFGAETYEAEAFSYLIKPVSIDKFTRMMTKVISTLDSGNQQAGSDMFIVRTESHYIPIQKSDIAYIEAEDKFVKINLVNGQQHIVWISLKSINEQLADKRFMRIHRSYLLNTEHVQAINNVDVKVANKILPLSEQFKQELFDVYVRKHLIRK